MFTTQVMVCVPESVADVVETPSGCVSVNSPVVALRFTWSLAVAVCTVALFEKPDPIIIVAAADVAEDDVVDMLN